MLDNGFAVRGIRFNLAGRQSAGLVNRGPEMHALCYTTARRSRHRGS
jgi:hypothetical protein